MKALWHRHCDMTSLVLGSAIVASVAAAANLVFARIHVTQKLNAVHEASVQVPVAGSLSGLDAIDKIEWATMSSNGHQQRYDYVVLFPILKAIEGIKFWQDVANHVIAEYPLVKFVGVCNATSDCELAGDVGVAPLTLLTAMDPLQMRAVAVAKTRDAALIYANTGLKKVLPRDGNAQEVAKQISSFVRGRTN
jgi:hypothetical protein